MHQYWSSVHIYGGGWKECLGGVGGGKGITKEATQHKWQSLERL